MKPHGYSLIQVLLVILISGLFSIVIMKQIIGSNRDTYLRQTPVVIERLHIAVQLYYNGQCLSGGVTNPTITSLVADGLLPSATSVQFPSNAILSDIQIILGSHVATYYTLTFKSESDAEIAASNQSNTTVSGNQATWMLPIEANGNASKVETNEYLRAFGGGSGC
ncbi:hypothetical protein KUL42_39010 [Alteromonas sp. KUL42]|uniref:hypothetical protein n=1 Tax=Alteromonas sp. KUL42 TaxID=2480797 RepID=UPI00103629D1|nr:hypothetical protein [Alteromonas sp. KUL42]TAP31707.1 hypothetical protein EYR97_19660 [Alteromonas sp. KUL42]GEA09140.1 hypothetical protein KUL42_39010 [Alteromonas sp. KUL42]